MIVISDQSFLIDNQSQFLAWTYGPCVKEDGLMDLSFFHTEFPHNGGIAIYKFWI